jgi:hypothetical protein
VSEGLIDTRLGAVWSDDVGDCIDREDLRAMLRSDETRELCEQAMFDALAESRDWPPERVAVDAVIRALAGDAA